MQYRPTEGKQSVQNKSISGSDFAQSGNVEQPPVMKRDWFETVDRNNEKMIKKYGTVTPSWLESLYDNLKNWKQPYGERVLGTGSEQLMELDEAQETGGTIDLSDLPSISKSSAGKSGMTRGEVFNEFIHKFDPYMEKLGEKILGSGDSSSEQTPQAPQVPYAIPDQKTRESSTNPISDNSKVPNTIPKEKSVSEQKAGKSQTVEQNYEKSNTSDIVIPKKFKVEIRIFNENHEWITETYIKAANEVESFIKAKKENFNSDGFDGYMQNIYTTPIFE